MSRTIKLSGREANVIRSIGFGLGVTGKELLEQLSVPKDELCDLLNTLITAGFVETATMRDSTDMDTLEDETFEINGSFASDIKTAMKR